MSVHEADEVFRTVMACNGKRWIKGLRETAIGSITIGQIDVSAAYSSLQLIHRGTLLRDESTYLYFHLFYLGLVEIDPKYLVQEGVVVAVTGWRGPLEWHEGQGPKVLLFGDYIIYGQAL